MMIQLTLISMSIPAILPIRNEPGIAIPLFMNVDVVSDLVFLFVRAVCGYPVSSRAFLLTGKAIPHSWNAYNQAWSARIRFSFAAQLCNEHVIMLHRARPLLPP